MPVPVVEYVVPGCLMCAKVRDDLLKPYVRKGIISLTIQTVGISRMFPSYNPDLYDYAFLYSETGKAITPTIKIGDSIFLQAMRYSEFEKTFNESIREVMSSA